MVSNNLFRQIVRYSIIKMKNYFLLIFVVFALSSCTHPDSLPDDYNSSITIEPAFYLQYATQEFSYHTSDDDSKTVSQGQKYDAFSHLMIYNGYLYAYPYTTMYRINPENGNITTVCTDPLCTHSNIECPFFDVDFSSFQIVDNAVYFVGNNTTRNPGKAGFTYYLYDIAAGTSETVNAPHSEDTLRINNPVITDDGWFYYYDCLYDDDKKDYQYFIRKYSLKTGEDKIVLEPDDFSTTLIDEIDGELYYLDGIGLGTFDPETGEKTQLYDGFAGNAGYDDEYFYFRDRDNCLYRLPIGSAEAERLTDFGVEQYYITDKYLYYKKQETNIIGYYEDGTPADIGSQQIWRMNKDGTSPELVWEFTGALSCMNVDNFAVLGDYIYSKFYYWDDAQKHYIESQNAGDNGGNIYLMRVDIENQELYFFNLTE